MSTSSSESSSYGYSYTLWENKVNLFLPSLPSADKMKEMDELLSNPTHGYFQTPEGKLHYLQYVPEDVDAKDIRAVCVFQHSIGGCASNCVKLEDGSYTKTGLLARKLKSSKMALYCLDMLGHGYSEGKRFYIPNGNWKVNRDHLESFARFVAEQNQNQNQNQNEDVNVNIYMPLFVMGDSYGGSLALHVARMWQNTGSSDTGGDVDVDDERNENKKQALVPPNGFQGICINAPGIIGDLPPLPILWFLKYILKPLMPEQTPFFMPHPITPDRIWKDEEVRKYYASEESKRLALNAGGIPFCLGTAAGLVDALEEVRTGVIPGFNVPFSVCHGTDDWGVKLEGTEYLVDKCDTKNEDRAVNIVEGAYHDLLADPSRNEVIDFHIKFIESRLGVL